MPEISLLSLSSVESETNPNEAKPFDVTLLAEKKSSLISKVPPESKCFTPEFDSWAKYFECRQSGVLSHFMHRKQKVNGNFFDFPFLAASSVVSPKEKRKS